MTTAVAEAHKISRSKREVFRGQNYHFQRGYELSRLRFENENKDVFTRPKAFFLREYHLGRDMPSQLLELTQIQKLSTASATARPLIDTTTSSGDHKTTGDDQGSSGHDEHQQKPKPFSNNYRQDYWATKAALKAALNNNEKDIRITEVLDALKRTNRPKSPQDNIEQIKDEKNSGSGDDGTNKNVHFDEQIKEDLEKIKAYDPR